TGGLRRGHFGGHPNIFKRFIVHPGAFNFGLLMGPPIGRGAPRGLLGPRRAAAGSLARPSEHLEAIDRARRRLQSRAPDAPRDRPRDAPRPSGPPAAMLRALALADPVLALRRAPSDSDEPQRPSAIASGRRTPALLVRGNIPRVMTFTTGC